MALLPANAIQYWWLNSRRSEVSNLLQLSRMCVPVGAAAYTHTTYEAYVPRFFLCVCPLKKGQTALKLNFRPGCVGRFTGNILRSTGFNSRWLDWIALSQIWFLSCFLRTVHPPESFINYFQFLRSNWHRTGLFGGGWLNARNRCDSW